MTLELFRVYFNQVTSELVYFKIPYKKNEQTMLPTEEYDAMITSEAAGLNKFEKERLEWVFCAFIFS